MTKTNRNGIAICEGIKEGKPLAAIARELGLSQVYVKKLARWLVCEGILVHHKPPYTVKENYKERLNSEEVSFYRKYVF